MKSCPKCGKDIPDDAPDSVCPNCLLDETLEYPEAHGRDIGVPGKSAPLARIQKFRLIEEIARGGMGIVYKAYQEDLDRMVAVKLMRAGRFADARERDRFQSEAEAAAKLRHPGIVAIHQIGEEDGNYFFSMDLVEGGDLDTWLGGRPMEDVEAARLLKRITEAVAYAHGKGIIHRDLKPQNVLMDAEGRPHVSDFGIAKQVDTDSRLTVTGVVMGSPSYMSPEQAAGESGTVGRSSDLYSLGAILYTLLTGRPPFQAATPMKTLEQVVLRDPVPPKVVNPSISIDLNTICLKCLSKAPPSRYQSAEELIAELDRFCAGKPILARPSSRTEKTIKWVRRNPLVSGLCAAVAGVALIGFVSVWWQLKKTEEALLTTKELQRAEASARAPHTSPRHVLPQGGEGMSVAFAPDGTNLVTATADGQWGLYNGHDGALLRSIKGHEAMIAEASFSSDGARVLTFSFDSQTHFPHLNPNGERVSSYTSHSYGDQSARLWDAATGTRLLTITNRTQVSSARLSPDGNWIAIATWDGLVEIYETGTGIKRGRYQAHNGAIQGLDFSPDSKSIVTSSEGTSYSMVLTPNGGGGSSSTVTEQHIAHILEVPSARPRISLPNQARDGLPAIRLLSAPGSSRCTARFSADGTRIVTAGERVQNTCLWNAQTGRLIRRLKGHQHSVYMAAFSPDGEWIASAGADNTAIIYNARTGDLRATLNGHEGPVLWVEFSPNSRQLLTASGDGSVRVWDAAAGVCIAVLTGHTKKVYRATFSPDGLRVASASADRTVCLWDAAPMDYLSVVLRGHNGIVTGMEFSADSEKVVTRSQDGTARGWALEGGNALWTLKGLPEMEDDELRGTFIDETLFTRLTPDASSLVMFTDEPRAVVSIKPTLGWGGTEIDSPHAPIKVWSLKPGAVRWSFPGFDQGVACVDVSPDGQLLAAGQDDELMFKNVYRGPFRSGMSGSTTKADGPTSVWLWDLSTGKLAHDLRSHTGKVELVRFSHDGSRLISSDREAVRVWDTKTGRQTGVLEGVQFARGCSFLPDGERVMLRWPAGAGLWSLETGKLVTRYSIDGRPTDIRECILSPNGQLAACITYSNAVYLCGVSTGEVVQEFESRRSRITAASFDPSGELFAAGSEDKSVKVWSVSTGKMIRTLEGHKASVTSVVFSPDGRWLGSTSLDFTARLWPVASL